MKAILTKMTILMRETNHDWLQNGNFGMEKLTMHGYRGVHGCELTVNEHLMFETTNYSFDLLGSKD